MATHHATRGDLLSSEDAADSLATLPTNTDGSPGTSPTLRPAIVASPAEKLFPGRLASQSGPSRRPSWSPNFHNLRRATTTTIQAVLSPAQNVFRIPRTQWETAVPRLKMFFYFLLGFALSVSHIAFYIALKDQPVGSAKIQERNIMVGTTLAFLSQITLTAAAWKAYTQCLWHRLSQTEVSIRCLDAAFGADTSFFSLLNRELARKFTVGFGMGLVAWAFILPPFFTPATLFVYPSSRSIVSTEEVLRLVIDDPGMGHSFAYSPPSTANTMHFGNDSSRIFDGPRTIMTLLSAATATSAEILPIRPPHNESNYSVQFFGPLVQCSDANVTAATEMDRLLAKKMEEKRATAAVEVDNAYYGLVPHLDPNGSITAVSKPRPQGSLGGTNEFWMMFSRWRSDEDANDPNAEVDKIRQVCRLYNASYELDLRWDRGFQRITRRNTGVLNQVFFPKDVSQKNSSMDVHAYSAYFWVLTDQLVGSLSWYEERDPTTYPPQFGLIDTPIRSNALLGSSDLDVFFSFSQRLYKNPVAPDDFQYSQQRQQDKGLARNRTLAELIEELSFNTTVSLMHNELLCRKVSVPVTRVEPINRYGYLLAGLVVPYALANGLALGIVGLGIRRFMTLQYFGGKSFSDIARASRDPELAVGMGTGRDVMVQVHLEEMGPVIRPRGDEVDGSARGLDAR